MTLAEQISAHLKEAMVAKDATRVGVLRMLKSAAKYSAISKAGAEGELDDAEVVAEVRKQIKQREDSATAFETGGRPELMAKEQAEIAFLKVYLPAELSGAEIAALVSEAIAGVGATSKAQMGAVMKAASARAAGRVDGRTLSAEVQKQLG